MSAKSLAASSVALPCLKADVSLFLLLLMLYMFFDVCAELYGVLMCFLILCVAVLHPPKKKDDVWKKVNDLGARGSGHQHVHLHF